VDLQVVLAQLWASAVPAYHSLAGCLDSAASVARERKGETKRREERERETNTKISENMRIFEETSEMTSTQYH
jgi:hypothetical protein